MKQLMSLLWVSILIFPALSFSAQEIHPRAYNREVLKQKRQAERQYKKFSRYEGRREKRYENITGVRVWIGTHSAFEDMKAIEDENKALWVRFHQLVELNADLWNEAAALSKDQNFDLTAIEKLKELKMSAADVLDNIYKTWERSDNTRELNDMVKTENQAINEYNLLIDQENSIISSYLPLSDFSYSSVSTH